MPGALVPSLCRDIVSRLTHYLSQHVIRERADRFDGALAKTIRTIPALPTWPHSVFPAADGYASLYAGFGKPDYRTIAEAMIDFLIREQSPTGCWYGYAGYPKSYGWSQDNAPPNSYFDVQGAGVVQDLIWSPFSVFGTALYSKVVFRASEIIRPGDPERARKWKTSLIIAFEFIQRCVDEKGYVVECGDVWDQVAEIASALAIAFSFSSHERFSGKAKKMIGRVLKAQLPSGEFPFAGTQGHSLHYHFLTLEALQDCLKSFEQDAEYQKAISTALQRGLAYAWSMQKNDGDFDWQGHAATDHKQRMFATFGLALLATAPLHDAYADNILHALEFLKAGQNGDGGFPFHLGGKESDTCGPSGTILQGLGRLHAALKS